MYQAKTQKRRQKFQPRIITPGILGLTLGLYGVSPAQADTAPERGLVAFKYLSYDDKQPGLDRISVRAPSWMVMMPIAGEWSVEALTTTDTVSGASPAYHSEKTSAVHMKDVRRGQDLRLTRYFPQGSLSLAGSHSKESDYESRALSISGSLSTEDKNTTLNLGMGMTRDKINPGNLVVVDEKKSINDFMIGLTQVMGTHDIAQLNLTYARGTGYFSDPYKSYDNRPDRKRQTAILGRWNHHFDATEGTSRLSYRYYDDSFGIHSHTVTAEYVQPLAGNWTITPLARIYSQNAARFYVDPNDAPNPTEPDNYNPGVTIISEDQRLSAFGAASLGFKVSNRIHRDLLIDFKYEYYEQRSQWNFNSKGSPGIDPLRANIMQLGVTYFF